jgi:sigma-B regulation protein RsbU (phosphoserine phosphatase)
MELKRLAINEPKDFKGYTFIMAIVVFSGILFRFAYMLEQNVSHVIDVGTFLAWHNLFEFSGILVCLAVFFVSYYTYEQAGSLRSIILGTFFLGVGMIDTFHTLSFKGMPDFFIHNLTANRATTFWIIGRMTAGIGFVAVSIIPESKKSKVNEGFLAISSLIFSITVFIIATYLPWVIPPMYIEGYGLTKLKIVLEYMIIALSFIAAINFIHTYIKTKDSLILYLVGSLILNIFSEFAFISYGQVYDIYNYIGHVYKAISYFIIFRVIFISNIQKPYIELFETKKELKNYADNLDRLVDQRTLQLKLVNKKLLEDLEYAKQIQGAMLPTALPVEKEVEFHAEYFPAERVSGDFYNVFKLDDDNIGLYIGDVSGHGVPAAMLTVFLNRTIKVKRETEEGQFEILKPALVLKNIYEAFNDTNFNDDVYIVLIYGVYNVKTRKLVYSSAGLNVPPVLYVKHSGEVLELEIRGFPICKFSEFYDAQYSDASIILNPGDKILFYTDGLTEAENTFKEKYSETRLKQIFSNTSEFQGTQLCDAIVEDVFNFIGAKKLKDDITFVAMELKPWECEMQ